MPLRSSPVAGWKDHRLIATAALITAGIFIADLQSPLGVTIGTLYEIPVLLGLFVRMPGFPIWVAAIATILTIVDSLLSSPVGNFTYTIVNRSLAEVPLWVTAWLVTRYASTLRALDRSLRELEDTNFALDQAAILEITDLEGRMNYVNDRVCELSQYSRAELLGRDHRLVNSGYHPKEFIRNLWQTIGSGTIWRGDIRNRAKDGTFYWVDTTIVPFLDDSGQPYQYMAIRYDITERKRSEALLSDQAALARLGEMAAVVAHEVKNPLAGIRGALQVIGGRMPEDSRERAILGDIVSRVDSLNEIVHDLLVFARPREPKIGPVGLAELLEDTAALIQRDPAHAGITLDLTGDRPTIQADAEQLRTVFLNLLLNAAQAATSNGHIRIAIASQDGLCIVSIADDGPGIPVETLPRIFEPFFTTKHRGTGLGLPTAKRMVQRHNGGIEFECPPEGGTIVTVTLPVDQRR
jgi:two-component system, sporulation sensor kinase A